MVARRFAKARDANEGPICDALERIGAKVYRLNSPDTKGIPDLLVGWQGRTVLMEVKRADTDRVKQNHRDGRDGLDPAQFDFHKGWRGAACVVVTTPDEALKAIGWTA